MKRLILIMLTVLATTAVAYRLPTAWTLGGGLSYDSVRVTVYRGEAGSATLTNEVDTSFVGAGTNGTFAIFVDSLVQYTVRYMYFSGTDTFREFSYNNTPVDYEKFARVKLQEMSDSLAGQAWATDAATSGAGIYAVTLYARDTVNSEFVSGINLTAVNGGTTYYATTDTSGSATFNVDGATWTFNASGSPYTWVPFSRTVGANVTDTINGGGLTVLTPSAPNLCGIQGYIKDLNNNPIAGALITFSFSSSLDTLHYGGTEYIPKSKQVYTSSTGYFTTELVPNSLLDADSYYIFKVSKTGVAGLPKERKIVVPDAASADIDDL